MAKGNRSLLQISNALFKSSLNKKSAPIFKYPIQNLSINKDEKWVIWGPGKSKLIDILSNKFLCDPPLGFRWISSKEPKVEQVQFKGVIPTAHLGARYEYFKDEFDQTCRQFILDNSIGSNNVNYSVQTTNRRINMSLYKKLISELKLTELQDRWAMGLSNGQMRRARLARAFLKTPALVLIDDPFLGLDPTASSIISTFLAKCGEEVNIPVIIGLRYQDIIPSWCDHIVAVDETNGILFQGPISEVQDKIESLQNETIKQIEIRQRKLHETNKYSISDLISTHPFWGKNKHEILKIPSSIEFKGVNVSYKGELVLKDLKWNVKRGTKWHIRGDNGTGKTTLLSMVLAEHPQSWNSKIIENGQERRTGKSNYFDINKRIGMSSPELHAIFAKRAGNDTTVRECISSGFHEGSANNFISMWKKLDKDKQEIIDMYMDYFGIQDIADKRTFGQLTVSEQKLVLFIRALIKMPEVLILDEAFSGMEVDPMLRCHDFLESWPGTVLVISHVANETPRCDHFIKLMGPGKYIIGDVEH